MIALFKVLFWHSYINFTAIDKSRHTKIHYYKIIECLKLTYVISIKLLATHRMWVWKFTKSFQNTYRRLVRWRQNRGRRTKLKRRRRETSKFWKKLDIQFDQFQEMSCLLHSYVGWVDHGKWVKGRREVLTVVIRRVVAVKSCPVFCPFCSNLSTFWSFGIT